MISLAPKTIYPQTRSALTIGPRSHAVYIAGFFIFFIVSIYIGRISYEEYRALPPGHSVAQIRSIYHMAVAAVTMVFFAGVAFFNIRGALKGLPRLELLPTKIVYANVWGKTKSAEWKMLGSFSFQTHHSKRGTPINIAAQAAVKNGQAGKPFRIPLGGLEVEHAFLLKELNRRRAIALETLR